MLGNSYGGEQNRPAFLELKRKTKNSLKIYKVNPMFGSDRTMKKNGQVKRMSRVRGEKMIGKLGVCHLIRRSGKIS